MKVGVVGTGYVGLVTGTCFAEAGNEVTCIDIDPEKVARMQDGEIPIYEPGLEAVFQRNVNNDRLTFSTDIHEALGSSAIFLALPTPPSEDGSADLSYVLGVADQLGHSLKEYTVVVNKSTVPVGTAEKVKQRIGGHAETDFDVVSNPEFLREGQAVDDFMHPDRVVIGSSSERASKVMRELYQPFVRRDDNLIFTSPESAEFIKYGANALLAAKISFMNGLTELAEVVGADINDIRHGIGADPRIGSAFLFPGPGYGGSCFPKDTRALLSTAEEHGLPLDIVQATIDVNERQKHRIPEKVMQYYGDDIRGKRFAMWGLAFKRDTDDVRESPALVMIDDLIRAGAEVVAFDPQAMENVKRQYAGNEKLQFAEDEYAALEDADALIIATEWKQFFSPNFDRIKDRLKTPVIFDGRNLYELDVVEGRGIHYESLGRRIVTE